jgi:hypothetical protein
MTIIELQHMIMVQPYNDMHMKLLCKNNPKMGINACLLKDHNAKFIRWLKDCRSIRDLTNEGVVKVLPKEPASNHMRFQSYVLTTLYYCTYTNYPLPCTILCFMCYVYFTTNMLRKTCRKYKNYKHTPLLPSTMASTKGT